MYVAELPTFQLGGTVQANVGGIYQVAACCATPNMAD